MLLADEKVVIRDGGDVHLNNDIISRRRDGSLLDIKRVLRDPRTDQRVKVWIPRDQRHQREATPFTTPIRNGEQGSEDRQRPERAKEAVEGTLVEVLGTVRQRQHGDDLQGRRRRGEQVTLQRREAADPPEAEGEVGLHGRGGDVGDEADEVQPPHGAVRPGGLDVLEGGGLVDVGEALGRVVAEDAVDHDGLLAGGVPRLAPEEGLGVCGRGGQPDVGDDAKDEGEEAFEEEEPEPAGAGADASHFKKTCGEEGGNDAYEKKDG